MLNSKNKTREDLWHSPAGYQRTSKKLQKAYLERLLARVPIKGRILDVGCGTANVLEILNEDNVRDYCGVDISKEMIAYASERFPQFRERFIHEDFLSVDKSTVGRFDHVVCAACLHWFHPEQQRVIDTIYEMLEVGGYLHLSTALSFDYLSGEELIQEQVLKEVRLRYKPIRQSDTFSSRRATREDIVKLLGRFTLIAISQHEEKLSFDNFEDFRDWHVGSGSVVFKQFPLETQCLATDLYYKLLYSRYEDGIYDVAYATALITAQKGDHYHVV
ncbi:tRNA (cmo5U34)-methyltransferase [Pseudomonas fluorescens]|nr:tRNA (cmo5U34)-methyltransferase [Pseudomonas fluorescens]